MLPIQFNMNKSLQELCYRHRYYATDTGQYEESATGIMLPTQVSMKNRQQESSYRHRTCCFLGPEMEMLGDDSWG
ncbi:hypothetical protein RRG08_060362 [Elysia crispata]|uniref:Uncharacterized protein n=1 Tax=Elysia crispata TaxID=231223 RepID=A0AAE0ZHM3_9GAST|nr:hypothetical protein RRG08_060362 [Elysia crispata]